MWRVVRCGVAWGGLAWCGMVWYGIGVVWSEVVWVDPLECQEMEGGSPPLVATSCPLSHVLPQSALLQPPTGLGWVGLV